jgi:hypothetical protein
MISQWPDETAKTSFASRRPLTVTRLVRMAGSRTVAVVFGGTAALITMRFSSTFHSTRIGPRTES